MGRVPQVEVGPLLELDLVPPLPQTVSDTVDTRDRSLGVLLGLLRGVAHCVGFDELLQEHFCLAG